MELEEPPTEEPSTLYWVPKINTKLAIPSMKVEVFYILSQVLFLMFLLVYVTLVFERIYCYLIIKFVYVLLLFCLYYFLCLFMRISTNMLTMFYRV